MGDDLATADEEDLGDAAVGDGARVEQLAAEVQDVLREGEAARLAGKRLIFLRTEAPRPGMMTAKRLGPECVAAGLATAQANRARSQPSWMSKSRGATSRKMSRTARGNVSLTSRRRRKFS